MRMKFQQHMWSHRTAYIIVMTLLLATGGFTLSLVPDSSHGIAEADMVTSSLTSVYKGTVQIVGQGGSPDSLTLGAGGSVISGTSQIFLMPNDSGAASYFRGVAGKQEQGLYLDASNWDATTVTAQNNNGAQHTLAAIADGSQPAAVFKGDVRIEGDLQKGDLQAVVDTSKGPFPLHVIEAPDARFIDYGKGTTENGTAHITIDPAFAETVSLENYSVFLTPVGSAAALAVADQTPTGFTVRAATDTAFSYKIVAVRKGYENKRFTQ